MIAVIKHELKTYFRSMTAYVFGAFLLAFIGVGAMMFNIDSAVSNFEYVLNFVSIVFIIIVPILTMRVIAEERKQKTDQLLYSLPITTTQVILGKYVALLVVFLVPMAIICVYPAVFSRFGDVYLLTSYGALLAFFILGAALLALGVFISSLTENQGLAAGVGVAVILFNYYSVVLSEYASASVIGTVIALAVLIVLIALVVRYVTRSTPLALGLAVVLAAAGAAVFFLNRAAFEGLLPALMTRLSLFVAFSSFVNGVFDMTFIVFYLSVIVFFLFLSVQSMEKRRYN